MNTLSNDELMNVSGGGYRWIVTAAATLIVMIMGVIDGYRNPLKCNNK